MARYKYLARLLLMTLAASQCLPSSLVLATESKLGDAAILSSKLAEEGTAKNVVFNINKEEAISIMDAVKLNNGYLGIMRDQQLLDSANVLQLDEKFYTNIDLDNQIRISKDTIKFRLERQEIKVTPDIYLASNDASSTEDLETQLQDLYESISKELNIPANYVKAVHLIAGGKAVYSARIPDIYNDLTAESVSGPFEIEGAPNQKFDKQAPFAVCTNLEIDREKDGKYYLPDAAYSVMCGIVDIMKQREKASRGVLQVYFDALMPDAKQNILFYEAVMQYCGYSESEVNALYKVYERLLYDKAENEYVIQLTSNGEYKIKDKFIPAFEKYGIKNTDILAKAMSFDGILAESSTPNSIKTDIPLHYKVGYTSRENMMMAAMSLVGKVRYVWGGGHGGSSNINGINPIWECFSELYDLNDKSNTCIQPAGTWCPVHGERGGACSLSDTPVRTIGDYLELRGDLIAKTSAYNKLLSTNLNKVFNNGNLAYTLSDGSGSSIAAHRVEGLDCSGFASWIYNQIDSDRVYDSNASNFVYSGNLEEIPIGAELYTGDVIAWSTHIVTVVGKLDDTNKVYIEIEQTPNVIKFGVAYYQGATSEQIAEAKQIAKEANILLGNVKDSWVGSYNINKLAHSTRAYTDESGNLYYEYSNSLHLGRLKKSFIDENETVPGYNKSMKEMTGKEIIQYTIGNMPESYVSGKEVYTGGIFNYAR